MSDHDLEAMLERAAEEGARRALSDVGLGARTPSSRFTTCARFLCGCRPACKEDLKILAL